MKASNSILAQGTASGEDIERYEVIDGVRIEREPMRAFETVLASWLCHLMNSFTAGKKLGLAVNEVYQSPTHVSILERTDTLDGGEVLPGFRLPITQLYEAVANPE